MSLYFTIYFREPGLAWLAINSHLKPFFEQALTQAFDGDYGGSIIPCGHPVAHSTTWARFIDGKQDVGSFGLIAFRTSLVDQVN